MTMARWCQPSAWSGASSVTASSTCSARSDRLEHESVDAAHQQIDVSLPDAARPARWLGDGSASVASGAEEDAVELGEQSARTAGSRAVRRARRSAVLLARRREGGGPAASLPGGGYSIRGFAGLRRLRPSVRRRPSPSGAPRLRRCKTAWHHRQPGEQEQYRGERVPLKSGAWPRARKRRSAVKARGDRGAKT